MVGDPVRIVTWNLQGSKLKDVAGVSEQLKAFDADIVCFQEVQRRQFRSISAAAGMRGNWTLKHWPLRRPAEGIATMSRLRIKSSSAKPISRREQLWSWRRRVASATSIEFDGADLHIVNTHLGAGVTEGERAAQAHRLVAQFSGIDFIVGDMNVRPDSDVLKVFAQLRDSWEMLGPEQDRPHTNWEPGPRSAPPVQCLDYVFVAPSWQVVRFDVPQDWREFAALSDHLPVIVDVVKEPDATVI